MNLLWKPHNLESLGALRAYMPTRYRVGDTSKERVRVLGASMHSMPPPPLLARFLPERKPAAFCAGTLRGWFPAVDRLRVGYHKSKRC